MNSYRIDTFQMEDGHWKAVAYQCGAYLGEAVASSERIAISKVAFAIGQETP